MSLLLPTPTGLPQPIANAFDDVSTAIQAWASSTVAALGRWVDVPFDAGNFKSANDSTSGIWTVEARDQKVFQYTILQDIMILQVTVLDTTTNATTGPTLMVKLPDGYQAVSNYFVGSAYYSTTAVFGTGVVYGGTATSTPGYQYLRILRDVLPTSTDFPNVTDALNIGFSVVLRVSRREL